MLLAFEIWRRMSFTRGRCGCGRGSIIISCVGGPSVQRKRGKLLSIVVGVALSPFPVRLVGRATEALFFHLGKRLESLVLATLY